MRLLAFTLLTALLLSGCTPKLVETDDNVFDTLTDTPDVTLDDEEEPQYEYNPTEPPVRDLDEIDNTDETENEGDDFGPDPSELF